jgi:hypothetical protein
MQDTITLITPQAQQKVEFATFITGRTRRRINGLTMSGASLEMNPETQEKKMSKTISEDLMEQAEDVAILAVVKSIDGNQEDILSKVLDMKGMDYDFIMERVDKICQGKTDFLEQS